MDDFSRRQFGRLAGVAGLGGVAGSAACSGSAPTGPPSGAEVGFVLSHEQFPAARLVSLAERAERAGFGRLWASDHLQPWQDNEGHSSFPWLTLSLVSQRTHRVQFGSGVTCPIYRHHPVDVAQAFATLEMLAPGRVFLGVGTGEAVNELAGTGQYGHYSERHDRLVEAVQLIRRLWTGQRVSFRGHYFRTEELKLYDLPAKPPPIHVAASGPKSARLAGQYGDGWITESSSVTSSKLNAAFADGAKSAGKRVGNMPRWAEMFAVVGNGNTVGQAAERWRFTAAGSDQANPVKIQQSAQRRASLREVAGKWATGTDPATHIHAVQRFLNQGVTPFVHFTQDDPEHAVEFYRQRVLPHLRS